MQHDLHNPSKAIAEADDPRELDLLREVLRLLPTGVTVQDEHDRLLIVNDAAAEQLGLADGSGGARQQHLEQRLDTARDLLRARQAAVTEECFDDGKVKQVWLTSHRPVQLGGRGMLISSAADISEQKA